MENSKESLIQQCIELGFAQIDASNAYENCQNKSLEGIIEYICSQQKNNQNQDQQKTENIQNQESLQQSISDMINKEFSQSLQEMGFSKIVSEKSLFLTQNTSIENAIKWIDEHRQDQDFEEELQIIQIKNEPKLTDEQAKQKAKELQQKIRENRAIKEKELALQQERDRIKGGKLLTQSAREQEEAQQRIIIQEKMRQKKEDELYKQKLLEKLELEKKERLGDKYKPPVQEVKTPLDNIKLGIKQLQIAHPSNTFPGMAKKALQTVQIYLQNIIKNPDQDKFRKINTENQAFKDRVGITIGGVYILNNCGFQQIDNFLVLQNLDLQFLNNVDQLLQQTIQNM